MTDWILQACAGAALGESAWEKASTIATVLATGAALIVPFVMDHLQRRRASAAANDDAWRTVTSVIELAGHAADLYDRAKALAADRQMPDRPIPQLIEVAEKAQGSRNMLLLFAADYRIASSVLRLTHDAAALADLTATACSQALHGDPARTLGSIDVALAAGSIRVARVRTQLAALRPRNAAH